MFSKKFSPKALPVLAPLVAAVAIAALGACSPRVDVRGNLPDSEIVDTIKVGQSTKDIVQELLGTPSTIATTDNEVWYYIGEKTETVAFFSPTVLDRKVLEIRFDENARVTQVARYGLEDGKDVSLVGRETPTRGKELGFVEQLIGNIGRFNTNSTDN